MAHQSYPMEWEVHHHVRPTISTAAAAVSLVAISTSSCFLGGGPSSLVGRRGYRAPPGNQFLIDVSRLEKYHRKRFAMLKS